VDAAHLGPRDALMPRAAIDVGSNSLLLTVLADDGAILHDEARVVGLGRGVGDRGAMQRDRMAAAEEVLRDYVARAQGFGVPAWEIRAVATSAARRAINADTFFAKIERGLGLRVQVISGDEEAHLTWVGGQRDLTIPRAGDRESTMLVVDVGGGSTELVLGTSADVRFRVSLEIGSVRLTEAHLCARGAVPDRFSPEGVHAVRNAVTQALATIEVEAVDVVIGVAGTVTTLAAMALGLEQYDSARVHGSTLDRLALNQFADALARADASERRQLAKVGVDRADYLLAGAVILDRVLLAARRPSLLVSDRGLRFGLLADT
jgi:exopolyphosphatase / guanosine-5'-triphosphate,3'-diphosphate pyrophosphatase